MRHTLLYVISLGPEPTKIWVCNCIPASAAHAEISGGGGFLWCRITVKVVISQINIFCHQLTQNTTTEFVESTKIYINCSEIQNISFANFRFTICINLCKPDIKQLSYFVLIDDKIC